jgi:hypothetical protein
MSSDELAKKCHSYVTLDLEEPDACVFNMDLPAGFVDEHNHDHNAFDEGDYASDKSSLAVNTATAQAPVTNSPERPAPDLVCMDKSPAVSNHKVAGKRTVSILASSASSTDDYDARGEPAGTSADARPMSRGVRSNAVPFNRCSSPQPVNSDP